MSMSSEELIRNAIGKKQNPSTPKKKKKTQRKKTEGIDIFSDSGKSKQIEFKDIKSPRSRSIRNRIRHLPLSEWVSVDFVYYTASLYKERYGRDWELNVSGSCAQVVGVKDFIVDHFGFCDNVILRDYLRFFFENHSDYFMQHSKMFYFSYLKKPFIMQKFVDAYDYDESCRKELSDIDFTESSKKKYTCIAKDDVESSQLLSDQRLVTDYGVIISVNWLLSKGLSLTDACSMISDACVDLYKRGLISNVAKATERFSPYPDWLAYRDATSILNNAGYSGSVIVTYKSDLDRFLFLKSVEG